MSIVLKILVIILVILGIVLIIYSFYAFVEIFLDWDYTPLLRPFLMGILRRLLPKRLS